MEGTEEMVYHLSELRKRLIVVLIWFFLTLSLGLYIAPQILLFIKAQPTAASLEWNVFSLTDGLFIYLRCAFIFAFLFTLPVALFEIDKEAKGTLAYVPLSFILFLTGLSFSYFLVFPMMIRFMETMNKKIGAVETYGIDRYFSFLFSVVFPLGVAFEMPLVILFLTRLGLLTPERIKMTRKYAYVGLAIVGSCISPPDFVSHLSVTVPLLLLFEISAIASVKYYRKLQAISSNT
jgi:sec-independent protein translocase protein TatC